MSAALTATAAEADSVDHAALRLMLAYVEAECLRIGAADAARHAALAAALMPAPVSAVLEEGGGIAARQPGGGRGPAARAVRSLARFH